MLTTFAYPGNMAHAQHAARALHEAGSLHAFVTTFAWNDHGILGNLLGMVPSSYTSKLRVQLNRRSIREVPQELIHTDPIWEMARTAALKIVKSPIAADLMWERSSHSFDRRIAKKYVPNCEAIQCFEYTALAAFTRARQTGVARILHLPSLDSREFEEIQRAERDKWPDLRTQNDEHFRKHFEARYRRRQQEVELADVIVANSSLTARSHIRSGADHKKVVTVPLGAPPPIESYDLMTRNETDPLRIIWAGPFSIRKGAHYLLLALNTLRAGRSAELHVYGKVQLPARFLNLASDSVFFHGSVPQYELFDAYRDGDVLAFPTLSDGFGMVVAESLAHAMPVITTNQAGAADLISTDNGLIVPAADTNALVEALRWCLDNRQRLREMRRFALQSARNRQWSDFRRDLICSLSAGLVQAGYSPSYKPLP